MFTNNLKNNFTEYYPVDLGLFSEKPFELLIIQEDKIIKIEQRKLIEKEVKLRDFLVGNEFDICLTEKLGNNKKLADFYASIGRGFQILGDFFDRLAAEFTGAGDVCQKRAAIG